MSSVTETEIRVEEQRGRDPNRAGRQARGNSKVHGEDFATLEARVALLETTIDVALPRLDKMEDGLEALTSHSMEKFDQSKEELDSLRYADEEQVGRVDSLEKKVMDAIGSMQAQLDALNVSIEANKGWSTIVAGTSGVKEIPKIDLPRPKEFKGVRDAKEVENFLWQVERYFKRLNLEEEHHKVRTASLFLSDNAMLWWHRKHVDIEKGVCPINTWEDFKKELKRQFYPKNVVYEAKKLRELKHKTTISDYVRDFTTLMLQIPNLAADDLLFYFIDGLQNWAKQELQRRGVKDVDEAIAVAESLME